MAVATSILLIALGLVAAYAAPLTRTVRQAVGVTANDNVMEFAEYKPDLGNLTLKSAEALNRKYIPLCDCKAILDSGLNKSGLYKIDPDGDGDFTVFCDMSLHGGGGGWTVFQRRRDDDTSFARKWNFYRNGFGNLGANFWLGLNKIKRITDMGTYELYIGLQDHYTDSESTRWAKYGSFSLGSEASKYKLTISNYDNSSTAGDSLKTHNSRGFSTLDNDNDSHDTVHCAETYKGGWWYKDCHDSNLNGVWYANGVLADPNIPDGIIWQHWKGDTYSLTTTVMAIRPV